jgi:primosomal protein N' (replication factor Y)
LSPSTVCSDCGSVLACENCGSPLVLHNASKSERIYICHSCSARRSAETRCDVCQSWNLSPLGVGIDRIESEVNKLFPSAPVFILDKDHASTPTKATKIVREFAGEKGGVIIGTELAFLYLQKIPYVGLVSIDSLFSIPDFGINERIFYLITRLLEISEVEAIIQTRNIGKQILGLAESGNILDFYRTEIEERKEMQYPPFSLFIKVTTEGTNLEIEKKSAYLKSLFSDQEPAFMKSRGMKTNKQTLNMILRLPKTDWPNEAVKEKLLLLPFDFLIKVDPESIL